MNTDRQALDALLQSLHRVVVLAVDPELSSLSRAHDADLDFDLSLPLLPYQRAGVAYALRQRRIILGDEMGLGKTPQLIAIALRAKHEGKRSLVVVPPSLRENWRREIAKFTNGALSVEVVVGTKPYALSNADVTVIGDAGVAGWAGELAKAGFGALLVDEAHRAKNPKAKRTIGLGAIARSIPSEGYVVLASGTPAVNRPVELVSPLNIIGQLKPVFGSDASFKWRYCDPVHNGFGYTFNGASNTAELNDKLTGTCMVRRRKEDVLKELPAKRRAQVAVALDNATLREYKRIEDDFLAWVYEKGGREAALRASNAEVITRLTALRASMGKAKVASAVEHIESLIEDDQPVVVFAWHREVIDTFIEACNERAQNDPRWSVVKVVGGMTDDAKQKAVDDFQSGRANIFIGNYVAGGVGLTLTRASQWVGIELPWTPADLQQAEDRIHRIGQTEAVTCWHITGAREDGQDTIDDRLFRLLNHKAEVLSSVIDGFANDLNIEAGSVVASLLAEWVG